MITSSSVLQVLAKLEAKAASRPQIIGRASADRQTQAAEKIQETTQQAQVSTEKVEAPEHSYKSIQEYRPAHDPLDELAQQAAPNYQRALVQAAARRNQLSSDIARLKAQLQAKGDLVDPKEAQAILEDMERMEAQIRQQIGKIMRSQSLARLSEDAPQVGTDNLGTTNLVTFVKNSQAAMLLGRFSKSSLEMEAPKEASADNNAPTPAGVYERMVKAYLPPVVAPELASFDTETSLLAELGMGAVRAA